jgi:hypothetical protein
VVVVYLTLVCMPSYVALPLLYGLKKGKTALGIIGSLSTIIYFCFLFTWPKLIGWAFGIPPRTVSKWVSVPISGVFDMVSPYLNTFFLALVTLFLYNVYVGLVPCGFCYAIKRASDKS